MDKNLWLEVIRAELGLLEKLANGMVGDHQLNREEVELAITRSSLVTKEFEMLLHQISNQVLADATDRQGESGSESEKCVSEVKVEAEEPGEEEVAMVRNRSAVILEPLLAVESSIPPIPDTPAPSIPVTIGSSELHAPASVVEDSASPPSVPSLPLDSGVEPEFPRFDPLYFKPQGSDYFALDKEEKKEDQPLFKPTPLRSLKEGLTLNDRYLFQRELFNNDKFRLDQAVETLDRLANIQEAVAYLKANFRWTKSEASEKFVLLVKRRFS